MVIILKIKYSNNNDIIIIIVIKASIIKEYSGHLTCH